MKEYLMPLWIFVIGNVMLALFVVFFPAFGDAQSTLETASASWKANFWGFQWAMTSTRLLIGIFAEGLILFAVAKSFLGLKR